MHTVTPLQAEQTAGGMLWSTPALVAIADSGCVGPLGAAFGAGYAIGKYIYQTWLSEVRLGQA